MTQQEQVLRDLFTEIVEKLFSAGIGLSINNNKIELDIPVKVRNGGTGVDALSGYVTANNDQPFTAVSTIPAEDVSGILAMENGGTGVVSVKGYAFGDGKSLQGVTEIPAHDVVGFGDMANQRSDKVNIIGGKISSTVIDGDISGNANSINTVLPLANGGTGVTSKEELKKLLTYASSGSNTDITSLSGMSTPLSVSQGGTGSAFINGFVRGVGTAYIGVDKINGNDVYGDIQNNADNVNGIVAVANGGTGVKSLKGYVVGTGDKPLSTLTQIPGGDIAGDISGNSAGITGILDANKGGTGLNSPDGYIRGNGSGFDVYKHVPAEHVDGLGDLALQTSADVNITGGQAFLNKLTAVDFVYAGETHSTYTMTNNIPLMSPTGFFEIKIGNRICKVPYFDY